MTTATSASGFEIGQMVKARQTDKTRSPYFEVRGINEDDKSLDLLPLDAPGNGNRAERRARYARERKAKK